MKVIAAPCLIAILTAVVGCSEPTGPRTMRVWGDVSYDGKPIEDGTIDFVASDGSPPAQAPIKAGHYDLPAEAGPLAGTTYRVEISALAKSGKTATNVMGDGDPTMEPLYNIIPPEFNTRSTLSAKISRESSENRFDFPLQRSAASKRP
jgi:hypothetical protein